MKDKPEEGQYWGEYMKDNQVFFFHSPKLSTIANNQVINLNVKIANYTFMLHEIIYQSTKRVTPSVLWRWAAARAVKNGR